MSRERTVVAVFVLIACWMSFLLVAAPPQPGWTGVVEAINQGLPKTAIQRLEPILQQAMEKKQFDEAIKAISLKVELEGDIQGNKPEEIITRLRAEIEKAPAEMKPVMHAVMANWLWNYFQQNRWRFIQRTQTSAPPNEDLTTWDLPRILAEIDSEFQQSLAEAATLKKIPASDYEILLHPGNAPEAYRPTLYDVLAHSALQFYSAGEQAGSRAFDAFDLSADSPIFASATEFLSWEPRTTDQQSPILKAIRLYQELLRFHQDDEDQSAFLDADLDRLNFGNNHAGGEEKAARYKAALRRMAAQQASHVISSRALHHLATVIHGEDDLVEARTVALEGMNRFPESIGGRRCFNLIQQIEARSSRVSTERVWSDPRPTIDVRYRNVTKIYFRLVAFDMLDLIRSGRWEPERLDRQQRQDLLARRPLRNWSADLPATADYKERVEQTPSPDDLASGSYYLIASHNEDFNDDDNQVSFTAVWVSNLALVTRNHRGDGLVDGFVLDARSGDPIAGATVRVWQRADRSRFTPLPSVRTDANGLFRIRQRERRNLMLLASHQGDTLASVNYLQPQVSPAKVPTQQTVFFTDRALYRPGQTIHYKGICLAVDQQRDNYRTLARRNLTVVLNDVNGKEIERVEHQTNDYGSFSGSVTAPRDRLMGRMTLTVPEGPRGSTRVSVEEYKRPKFRVQLDRPETAAKLGGEVRLEGTATAYTGAAIDGASVRWRVVREVRYPPWWFWRCWWMPPLPGSRQEIARGRATTTASGTFEIAFVAKPDASVPEESEPTFRYSVYADVTDTTGETRSDQQTVNAGYTALAASMSAADWLTDKQPTEINIRTETLDGVGQTAGGKVRIYAVQQPDAVTRPPLADLYYRSRVEEAPQADPANPNSWPLGRIVHQTDFETGADGTAKIAVQLNAGMYRAKLETQDRLGKPVTADFPMQVLDPEAGKLGLKLPNLYASPQTSVQPGEEYLAIWGSGYETARAYVEVEHRGRLLQSYWTRGGTTQVAIKQQVTEAMRGGFTVRTTMVRENRAYMESKDVAVPWTNKQLALRWERVRTKLQPGAKETWTAIVSGPDAKKQAAEMVATLYDASLDAFQPHHWPSGFNVFRREISNVRSMFENRLQTLQSIYSNWRFTRRDASLSYRRLPSRIMDEFRRNNVRYRRGGEVVGGVPMSAAAEGMGVAEAAPMAAGEAASPFGRADEQRAAPGADGPPTPDLSMVSARKNLNETAFFFPHLVAGEDGTVKLEFTMPEALTEWKFLGFAHDTQLRGGLLTGTTVTAKDLMVQPNPPRFVREGDIVEFAVKVSNQSATRQSGTVRLSFHDARSGDSVDAKIGNDDRDQEFEIAAGESMSLSWRLSIPDDLGFLTYRAVGSTGRLSDGEEGFLPVLSRRILVTESLTLPIRGRQTKQFEFTKLLESGRSDSLRHQSLTVQMVSNPSWYAVMALPYLMEYPYECTEQVFNRLYANSLARYIAASDPKIHRIFEQWRGTPALDSPLEKNQDIKAVMNEETPWYRQAKSESQARRNVSILFDDNRLDEESARALFKLTQMQLPDGAWPWFPGGPPNDYITLYITTGFGRMRHLGVDVDTTAAVKSLRRLDAWVTERYQQIKPPDRKRNHLTTTIAFYLYGRSFFLQDQAVAAEHTEAVNYWLSQAKTYWLDLAHRQSQAHMAVALKRFGDLDAAIAIVKSIKERSVTDEEMGMFWRDLELSWWWYRAPIETQAMMIEALDEVMNDREAVEECKVWLLKQKQTQDWKTTKATADAVYALLLRGTNLLASDGLVRVSLGGEMVNPDAVEAGTGFYEQRFLGGDIQPKLGQIEVKKIDEGVAWGSLHWQYLEDISKIASYEGTPLKLTKQLYVKRHTEKGPTLEAVDGPVAVGDELVVRLVLRADRDMEYVHLKDYRGSGTEPVNVMSRYRYQDGLAYYESTRDTASHFFIDYLPKGTYVLEYSTRVQLRGEYQTGIASIQCMYAPEFNSHSESLGIVVE